MQAVGVRNALCAPAMCLQPGTPAPGEKLIFELNEIFQLENICAYYVLINWRKISRR